MDSSQNFVNGPPLQPYFQPPMPNDFQPAKMEIWDGTRSSLTDLQDKQVSQVTNIFSPFFCSGTWFVSDV